MKSVKRGSRGRATVPVPPVLRKLTDRQILLLALAVNVVLSLVLFDPKPATAGDNFSYVILARSIAQGSYRDLYVPGAPPHTLYPPGFPALIAPVAAIAGDSFVPMKLVVLFCSIATLLLLYGLLSRSTERRYWVVPLFIVATCPLLLEYSHEAFSEIPFLFFTVMALYLHRIAASARNRSWLLFLASALAVGCAYYIRSQGLFLIGAVGLSLLLQKRWQMLVLTALTIGLIALPWFVRNLHVLGGGYLSQLLSKDPYNIDAGRVTLADMIIRFVENSKVYTLRVFSLILFPILGDRANAVLLGAIGVFAWAATAVGFVTECRRKGLSVIEWYTILMMGIVLNWPRVWSGDRFLIPILPFLFYYFWRGLSLLAALVHWQRLAMYLAVSIIGLFVLTNLGRAHTNIGNFVQYLRGDRLAGYDEAWRAYINASFWLRTNTEPGAVVVSRKPNITYFYSGRQSFAYPFTTAEQTVLDSIVSGRASYVFLETFFGTTARYLYPVVRDHPDRFQQLAAIGPENARVYILKFLGSDISNKSGQTEVESGVQP